MSSKFLLVILALSTGLVLSACQTPSDGNLYGYDFQTAKIAYKISGSSEGTSNVLIKGEKKYIHNLITQKKISGETVNIDTIMILNGDKLYTLDPATKTGSQITPPFYAEMQKLSPAERQQRLILDAIRDDRTPEEQKKSPPQPARTEVIAGQTCSLYLNKNLEACLWQGIPLKNVASLPDYDIKTETTATSIDLNQPISDSEFDVPKDYKITELN
jgi:hypothetical protein